MIQNGKCIGIHGDFDSDGMLGSLILTELLKLLKAPHCGIIPKRSEGHGLSIASLDRAIEMGAEFIISVDCGINAIKEVDYAKTKGLDVMITDHHLPDDQLPNAIAICNPQLSSEASLQGLSGTGVALKLALSTLDKLQPSPLTPEQTDRFINEALVISAIATVADVMPLIGMNRALVKNALHHMDKVQNHGLRSLIKLAKIKQPAQVEDLSFQLIPRINSAQRMERGDLMGYPFS